MQLKAFIADYTFRDEVEEIEFFKTVKPRICHRLIYYRKIYNIEMNRPVGSESQRSYLIDEIRGINRYNEKRSDFVRYYRSGLTHLDALYYLRGNLDTALYLESFHHERDPSFSTNCNFMAARLLANERLIRYLTKELEAFELRDKDDGTTEYEAWLSDGTELDFDGQGDWTSVDCKFSALPNGILPEAIATDIATRYPDAVPYKVEKQPGGYEIDIPGWELYYNNQGTFIRAERDL